MRNDSFIDENPVEALAAEYAERRRRGEHPSIAEYAERHPELADEIRAFFPALALVEELKPGSDDATDSFAGSASLGGDSPRERLGDFRLLREIGRGGMGVVYEAEQESLSRRVALKVLGTSTLLDPQTLRRFHREARAAANLHHTHIVPVFGVGEEDGLHFYVMQFIPGLSLDAVLEELKRLRARKDPPSAEGATESPGQGVSAADVARSLWTGQFPPITTDTRTEDEPPAPTATAWGDESEGVSSPVSLPGETDLSSVTDSSRRYVRSVAGIGEQVAGALEHAHEQGTWHRDIKPSNLLLDAHGSVWVTDFGLAKATGDDDLTHTGDVVGTVRYMAPERFRGRCDARSDVYALGLTLYEMLAFRPAFPASDRHELVRQITQEEPPRLRRLDPAIPRDLETIVHKAIEKDPTHRYATAAALAEDLRRFLEDRPIRARRVPAAERLARWARRNKGLAASLAAVALLLVVVAVSSTIAASAYQRQAESLRWLDHIHRVSRAYQEAGQGDIASAKQLLRACPAELKKRWEWRYAWRLCHLASSTFDELSRGVQTLAYGPKGLWIAIGTGEPFRPAHGDDCEVLVKGTSDESVRKRWVGKSSVRSLAVSRDGRIIAIGTGSWKRTSEDYYADGRAELVLWEWEADRVIARHRFGDGEIIRQVAFSPDGKSLAVCYGRSPFFDMDPGGVRFFDTVGRELAPLAGPGDGSPNALAYAPDGSLAIAGNGGITILRPSGEVRPRISTLGSLFALAVSPDGKTLAAGGWFRTITLWDLETGHELRRLYGHTGFIRGLVFSPDGKSLASASEDRTVRLWDVATGTLLATMPGHESFVFCAAFRPDGEQIASGGGDRSVKFWDVPARQEFAHFIPGMGSGVILGQYGYASGLAFGPDSQALGSGTNIHIGGSFAWIWDAQTGRRLRAIPESAPLSTTEPSRGVTHALMVLSPDLRLVAARKERRLVEVLDVERGRPVMTLTGPDTVIEGLAFSPGGDRLSAAGRDGRVTLWDLAGRREIWSRPIHDHAAGCLVFNHDGSLLASTSEDGSLKILRTEDGTVLLGPIREPGHHFGRVAFHPREPLIAAALSHAGDQNMKPAAIGLYDLRNGRLVRSFLGHSGGVLDVAFSPDGGRLASASDDRTVKLWDTATGDTVLTLLGHTAGVLTVAFSPDGNLLASGGIDFTVRIWDARPFD